MTSSCILPQDRALTEWLCSRGQIGYAVRTTRSGHRNERAGVRGINQTAVTKLDQRSDQRFFLLFGQSYTLYRNMRCSSSSARACLSSTGRPYHPHNAPSTASTPRNNLLLRRLASSFPTNSSLPPSPLLPLLHTRRGLTSTAHAAGRPSSSLSQASQQPPTSKVGDVVSEGPNETFAWESDPIEPDYPPPSSDGVKAAELDLTGSGSSGHFSLVRSRQGQTVLRHIILGRDADAETALRDLASNSDPMIASADEVKQLTEAVLDLILYPSAHAAPSTTTDLVASGSSSHSRVEQADPESATHHGSTLTRRAIRLLHFMRVHGQPRTEAMYGTLIRRILDQGHVDLAARVYVELVEEWAWEQKRAAGRSAGTAHAGDPFDAIEEEVGWLRKVEWVDPVKEDVWEFEKWRRGPEAAEEDLPGQPFEQARFALFRERRRQQAEANALQSGSQSTAAEVEIAQHKRELEQDAPFKGFFGGLRWNHRAEAQRRTLCWAPSPSRLRLYLRRFPPSISQAPQAVRSTTIPFPSMSLLNPILERAAGNLTSLSPYGLFARSASALAIIANTIHSRTLPLSHVSVLIRTFESLPQFPRVHAPLPSPDPVDDTTAFTHVQSALASLIYGLPPGSMTENVERFGLNSISEGSANSLLSYSLTTLNSPTKGEKVLSYMRCQGYLNSPASSRTTGQILIKAGLRSKIWRYFVDGFQMAIGEMTGAFIRLVHERPATPEALRLAEGSQWQIDRYSTSPLAPNIRRARNLIPQLELPDHPLPQLATSRPGFPENGRIHKAPLSEESASLEPPLSSASDPASAEADPPAKGADPEAAAGDFDIDSFPFPAADELGPSFEEVFKSFLQSSAAHDPSAAATNLLLYAAEAYRTDLVIQMHRYLLSSDRRPVQMTGALYKALVISLATKGYRRTAEQTFCLARKELTSEGLDLDVDVYVAMLELYASIRTRAVGYYSSDGTWLKHASVGHVYPGELDPAERALRNGWALYRGIVWGQWEHWNPLQERIILDTSSFPRRRWFQQGLQQHPSAAPTAVEPEGSKGEPDFHPPASVDLPRLFNAAIRLLRFQEGMTELPRHVMRSKDVLHAMIATVKKKMLNARRTDAPELAGPDFLLSLVALDIRRAGFLVPLGVELLLAKYPQYHERIQQVRPIRPLSALPEAEADFGYSYSTGNPYSLPRDVRGVLKQAPERTAAFDGAEMDRLGSASSYPAGTFDGCDITPSDWPLLVWAALEGRHETDFTLPPGLWDAALEFKDNFRLTNDGQYLLLTGRLGEPVPFVPFKNREDFIRLNTPARLLGRVLVLRDDRLRRALGKEGWWPGMEHDLRMRPREAWLKIQQGQEYQANLVSRVDDVVSSGARREDPADWDDEADDGLGLKPPFKEEHWLGPRPSSPTAERPSPNAERPSPPWAGGLAASLQPPPSTRNRPSPALPIPPTSLGLPARSIPLSAPLPKPPPSLPL